MQSIHYVLDQYSKVYALVTLPSYSPRVAFTALEELKESFQREFGSRMATSGEGSLTKVATPLLKEFVQKYIILLIFYEFMNLLFILHFMINFYIYFYI